MDNSEKVSLPHISRRAHGDLIALRQLRQTLAYIEGNDPQDTLSLRQVIEDALQAQLHLARQKLRRLLPSLPESLHATAESVLHATDQRRSEHDLERDDEQMPATSDDATCRPCRPDPDRFRAMTPQELLHTSGSAKAVGKDPAPRTRAATGIPAPKRWRCNVWRGGLGFPEKVSRIDYHPPPRPTLLRALIARPMSRSGRAASGALISIKSGVSWGTAGSSSGRPRTRAEGAP